MVMKLIKFIATIGIALFSLAISAQSPEVIASVDKNPVIQGEPFILTITVDDDVSEATLNIHEQLQDFLVLSTSSSKRTSVINGVTTRSTSFMVHLQAPETVGTFRIPAIKIHDSASNAIELEVIDAQTAEATLEQRPAFIRTILDTEQVYVQQQFKLISRLYLSANLHSGNLTAPTTADADVVQFGADEESYEIINGKRYHVFQRTYLITPQRSGTVTIEGPVFNGQIARDAARSLFSAIANTQPVSAKAPPTQIEVLPRPSNWQGHWLPAELVTLTVEQVEPEAPISVGQPITLTYRLTALGVRPEQLPQFNFFDDLEQVSVYPEAPELGSTVRNGKVIAQRSQTLAVIPRTEGTLTLPGATVPWFNTRLGKMQLAQTDAITIDVGPGSMPLPNLAPNLQPSIDTAADSLPHELDVGVGAKGVSATPTSVLATWLMFLFGGLWVLTLIALVWLWRRTRQTPLSVTQEPNLLGGTSLQEIQQAAKANNAKSCEDALRQWGRNTLTLRMDDLLELADYFQYEPLTSQLEHLQQCRYGQSAGPWLEGKALLRALTAALRQQPQPRSSQQRLQPLYPS